MISERLSDSNILLQRNRYDNTCKILSAKQLNLLNFGPLLGFPVNKVIQPNTRVNSPLNVDVNLGLRYVTVECNCVDTDRNFDSSGRRSKVIATVPITSEQSLNSTITFYDAIKSEVSVLNGDHNMLELNVDTNTGNKAINEGHRSCHRAKVKEHLLQPCRELSVCGKVISEGKGEGSKCK